MKKIFLVALSAALLAACGTQAPPSEGTPPSSATNLSGKVYVGYTISGTDPRHDDAEAKGQLLRLRLGAATDAVAGVEGDVVSTTTVKNDLTYALQLPTLPDSQLDTAKALFSQQELTDPKCQVMSSSQSNSTVKVREANLDIAFADAPEPLVITSNPGQVTQTDGWTIIYQNTGSLIYVDRPVTDVVQIHCDGDFNPEKGIIDSYLNLDSRLDLRPGWNVVTTDFTASATANMTTYSVTMRASQDLAQVLISAR